jgi:hypothetical protein
MFEKYNIDQMEIRFIEEDEASGEQVSAQFICTDPDGHTSTIPVDPANRHFVEIKEWYHRQKTKPFVFDFDAVETTD